MRNPRLIATATLGAAILAAASGAFADTTVESVGTDLTLVHISGSRDLTISSVSGGDFTTVDFGTVREAPFLANVTDLLYDQVAYELNASMSNLHFVDGGATDCAADAVPSDLVSVDFPALDAVALTDLRALSAPVFELSGAIGAAVAALDPTGTLTAATELSITLSGSILDTAQDDVVDVIVADVDAFLATLPLRIDAGAGGGFTAPLAHPTCGGAAAFPTAVGVQTGAINPGFSLDGLLGDIFDALAGVDATLTADELIALGVFDDAIIDGAVEDALATLLDSVGASPAAALVEALVDDVRASLSATLADLPALTALLGQSGSYNTVAKLVIADLSAALPSLAPGTYGGTLEFTLVDKDS